MTNYQSWEDQLNNLGLYANTNELADHLAAAPKAANREEAMTINLLKKVIETRQSGGDITKIIYH